MEEQELIAGCLRGRMEDFRMIVEKYTAPAMALAVNILGNRDDAEDACQELFVQVYRNLKSYDMNKSFKNWLYTILYRRCLDHLRKRRRSAELLKRMGREAALAAPDNPGFPDVQRNLPSDLLEQLKTKEQTALCLWANEGYSSREISEVLRCSAGTARVYLFQARKKIKKLLEQGHVSLQNG
ncbi:MAG: RNA polymerase sigma factor [Candidatus Aminicenantales bacterium]